MSYKNVLFIFKDRKSVTLNNDFWSEKFKHQYNVTQFFLNDNLQLNNDKIIDKINELINLEKINIILFEGDHAHIINYDFIKKIDDKVKKGIFLGDDMVWHNLNLITSQSCDFVLSSCPISALKFEEIGTKSFFAPIECDGKLLKDYKLDKIFDVLHFGREKKNRSYYIDFLKENNINVKSVSPYHEEANTFEKLAKLINQSKIILNFSESSNGDRKFNPLKIYKSFYQLKGRIQMAGLSNSLCITEYSPSIYMMYDKDELPSFTNKNECLDLIKLYLGDEQQLIEKTKKFNLKSMNYEDSKYILQISKFIEKIKIKKKEYFNTPFWYDFIFLNQTLRLRFKRIFLTAFFLEFLSNIFYKKKNNPFKQMYFILLSLLFFFRYLPFLLLKLIFQFKK